MEAEIYEKFVPLIQKSKGYEELKKEVIDAGLCSACGACGAFCEKVSLDEKSSIPNGECSVAKGALKCNINGLCYDVCPHISYNVFNFDEEVFGKKREDTILGNYIKIISVRAKDKGMLENSQDGGAVTALLTCALEQGIIEGANVTARDDAWEISSYTARDREGIAIASGTKYFRALNVYRLREALKQVKNLAIVGTGCQIAGLRKIERRVLNRFPNINMLLIGLFCYENFPKSDFRKAIEEKFGIKIEEAKKIDITKGKVKVWLKKGNLLEKPVKEFSDITPASCLLCRDFTASFSDISAGSIGSDEKWTTLIIRTEKGENLVKLAEEKGYIEVSEKADKEAIIKTASFKAKKREKTEAERKEKGLIVPDYGY